MANQSTQKDYIGRINSVILYINTHLDEDLHLNQMAKIACFSAFHFHRIFTSVVGETLNNYINRKRIEKVASQMLQGSDEPLSNMAFTYGFKNASSFSRSFKKFYGLSPSEFKAQINEPFSKIGKTDSKNGQEKVMIEKYICDIDKHLNWLQMNTNIEVKQMPAIKMAYMDHIGAFDQIGTVYEKLFRWAGPKGLFANPEFKTITLYHDDPKVTDIEKVRQSAGVTLNQDIQPEGEVGVMDVNAGKYAVGRFEVTGQEFGHAWDSMCIWVAEKGYKSIDGHYYELYHNDHTKHPEKKFIVDICIPVE